MMHIDILRMRVLVVVYCIVWLSLWIYW